MSATTPTYESESDHEQAMLAAGRPPEEHDHGAECVCDELPDGLDCWECTRTGQRYEEVDY